jgi:hypothetical protein
LLTRKPVGSGNSANAFPQMILQKIIIPQTFDKQKAIKMKQLQYRLYAISFVVLDSTLK